MLVYQRVSLSESRSLSLLDHLEIARKLWTFWNPNSWNAALVIVTHRFCTITYHVHIRNTTWRNTTLLMTTVVRLDMNRYRHIMMSRQIFLPFTRNMCFLRELKSVTNLENPISGFPWICWWLSHVSWEIQWESDEDPNGSDPGTELVAKTSLGIWGWRCHGTASPLGALQDGCRWDANFFCFF